VTFAGTGMTLASTKCYIGYHSIELLGHVVDRFGLDGYYRFFIEQFRYKANPLNKLKMELY